MVKKASKAVLLLTTIFFITSCARREREENIFNEAVNFWQEGKYQKAIKSFEAFIDLYSDHELAPKAINWIGDIKYIYLNKPIQALYDYRSLVKKYPKSKEAREAQWKISKAIFETASDKSLCIKEFQTFIKLYPKDPLVTKAHYYIAEAYIQLEEYGQAITELELFIKRFPNTELLKTVVFKLGELFYLTKDFSKAIHFLEWAKGLEKEKTSETQINKLMAECYISQGNIGEGLNILEETLNMEKDKTILKKRIESLKKRKEISENKYTAPH